MSWKAFLENKEMEAFFKKRTLHHISLVSKYCKKLSKFKPEFKALLDRAKVHDDSKFKNPEYEPYILITWRYKLQAEGKEFKLPDDFENKMAKATHHHITTNSHHPEYHSKEKVPLFKDRNKGSKIIATSMPDLDLAEMVADWAAMSEEKNNSLKSWADDTVGKRWIFSDKQEKLIYQLIEFLDD